MLLRSTLLLLLCFLYAEGLQAQSLRIRVWNTTKTVNNDTLTFYPDPRWPGKVGATFNYQNAGSKEMIVRAKKWDVSLTPNALHSICFAGECYGPNDVLAPNADTVSVNSSSYLQGSYDYTKLNSMPPNDLVAYILYDEDNPADSAIVYARFAENTTSINETVSTDSRLRVYPNPSADATVFESAEAGTLYISNSIGQLVMQQQLVQTTTISTRLWPGGIYYYRLRTERGGLVPGSFTVIH